VVWIKIISYQMLRTAFLFYRHKQRSILAYSEIPFASMKRTLSIRLSNEADRNGIYIYICRIESVVSLFVYTSAAYTRNNSWALHTNIHIFYYQKYCWKFLYTSTHLATWENLHLLLKNLKNNIKIKVTYSKIRTPIIKSPSVFCINALDHWATYTCYNLTNNVNVYSVSLVTGT
jgi:hypothetical protein